MKTGIKFLGLGIMFGIIGLLWYAIPMMRALPSPTGRYAVGSRSDCWQDNKRIDPHMPGNQRELSMCWWYPTHASATSYAPYLLSMRTAVTEVFKNQSHVPKRMWQWLLPYESHTLLDVPMGTDADRYPLIIFSHGFGSIPEGYSVLLEELASHGYVVLGINHTYIAAVSALCNNQFVFPQDAHTATPLSLEQTAQIMADDIRFVIGMVVQLSSRSHDSLYQKIDISRIGVLGHSMGGVAALKVCQTDARCKAGVDMDGWVIGLQDLVWQQQTPFLFLLGEQGLLSSPMPTEKELRSMDMTQETWREQGEQGLREIKNICSANVHCHTTIVPYASHAEFGDWALIKKPWDYFFFPSWSRLQSQDASSSIEQIRSMVLNFFDEHIPVAT